MSHCSKKSKLSLTSLKTRLTLFALAAIALNISLVGCGSATGSGTGVPSVTIPNADGRVVPAQTNLPSLNLTISTDKTTYHTGDPIHMSIAVTNTDTKAHSVSFTTGAQTNWWGYIIAQNGKIVTYEYWPGHKQVFPANVGLDSYAAGETHTYPYEFPYIPDPSSPPLVSTLPPGTYQIYARYPATLFDNGISVNNNVPTPVSAGVTITVTQ